MNSTDLDGTLAFLRAAERLKATHRSAYTSAGERESTAEHSWRLCLMAMVLAPEFPGVDVARLLRICIVHDLGEAVGGDVPAPEQARLAKALDKLETMLQHTQGDNPPDFDYRFNLGYGRRYTAGHPAIEALRAAVDRETQRRAVEAEGGA